jgi:hypothetical protein
VTLFVDEAISERIDFLYSAGDDAKKNRISIELAKLKGSDCVVELNALATRLDFTLPDYNGVFRRDIRQVSAYKPVQCLVPSTGAMYIVLRAGLAHTPSYLEIESLVRKWEVDDASKTQNADK